MFSVSFDSSVGSDDCIRGCHVTVCSTVWFWLMNQDRFFPIFCSSQAALKIYTK